MFNLPKNRSNWIGEDRQAALALPEPEVAWALVNRFEQDLSGIMEELLFMFVWCKMALKRVIDSWKKMKDIMQLMQLCGLDVVNLGMYVDLYLYFHAT